MADSGECRYPYRRKDLDFGRIWCCTFPWTKSPEIVTLSSSINPLNPPKNPKTSLSSVPNSPSPISNPILGSVIGRIRNSPGRVSPINETSIDPLPEVLLGSDPESAPPPVPAPLPQRSLMSGERSSAVTAGSGCERSFDLRLDLKWKDGRVLQLDMDSEVLRSKSFLFAEKIAEARRRSERGGCCSIEVEDVGNLEAFTETITLMYEEDPSKRLVKIGVSLAIDILEVRTVDVVFFMP